MNLPERVWVCQACGKLSADRDGLHAISRGWDVSCCLHAILYYSGMLKLNDCGRVVSMPAAAVISDTEGV